MSGADIVFERCFNDCSEFFLKNFYENIAPFSEKMSICYENKAVSTGYLFEVTISDYKGYYLYGLATLPEYRNKGYMTSLLKNAEKTAIDKGLDFIYLATNSCKAEKLYRNNGFEKVKCGIKLSKNIGLKVEFKRCTIDELVYNTDALIKVDKILRLNMLKSVSESICPYKSEMGYVLYDIEDNMIMDFYSDNKKFADIAYNSFNYPQFFCNEYTFMLKKLNPYMKFNGFNYLLN